MMKQDKDLLKQKSRIESSLVRHDAEPKSAIEPLAPPIEISAVYRVDDLDRIDALYESREAGFIYARDSHPGAVRLAKKLATLEGAERGLVCGSGMAAEAAIFLALASRGDSVAIADGLYGRTVKLVVGELPRFGIAHKTFDPTDPSSLARVVDKQTRLIFVESISNPLLRVADLPGLAEVAEKNGSIFVVDNTFAPLICRPIDHGADLVVHSLTKLIGGHSDLILGGLAGSNELIARCESIASTFGLTGNAFDSRLALRGLATLAIRSRRTCESALELAERLSRRDDIKAVHYPGLTSSAEHDRAKRMLVNGFGNMVTIDLETRDRANMFIKNLEHIPFAPSLGDVVTTLSHPATTSHRGQSAEQWARQGITPGLVRLSIGLEDPADLFDEIDNSLRTQAG